MKPHQQPTKQPSIFLTATWANLLMLNYPIDPAALAPYVPNGTELDDFNGVHYVSLVGFQFLDTRVKRVPIPFHRNFDEVNLRFYVRHKDHTELKRGVVFVREVVPKRIIATVARMLYGENYAAHPMRSTVKPPTKDNAGNIQYAWKHKAQWLSIAADLSGEPTIPRQESEQTFITEHYWGYAKTRSGTTVQYKVEHPQWQVWNATNPTTQGDFSAFYGRQFAACLTNPPSSAFVAVGSRIAVRSGAQLT